MLEKVREKRPRNLILLHHDNASLHTANKTMSFLTSEEVKLVIHPAFSPDLASCDFFIFTKIEVLMKGLTFTGPEEAVLAFNQHVQNMPSDNVALCRRPNSTSPRLLHHDNAPAPRAGATVECLLAAHIKLSERPYFNSDLETIVIEVTVSVNNSLEHLRRNVLTVLEQLTRKYCSARHAGGHQLAPAHAV
ncbi:Histone-lysine N-methyltransferase SETMAR [Eumeta japonica]|uniref:Histone-lysine N-methyltransferase SETMAR n=1 Tax=Eumeta variegata TaxID=151549 RepID=A0A4C1VU04_EUMVA|nr:Histone-lysine N-methyltransferase SETMAR [Eumeta japonica]